MDSFSLSSMYNLFNWFKVSAGQRLYCYIYIQWKSFAIFLFLSLFRLSLLERQTEMVQLYIYISKESLVEFCLSLSFSLAIFSFFFVSPLFLFLFQRQTGMMQFQIYIYLYIYIYIYIIYLGGIKLVLFSGKQQRRVVKIILSPSVILYFSLNLLEVVYYLQFRDNCVFKMNPWNRYYIPGFQG